MAVEVHSFTVSIPANTPKSANFSVALSMPARVVERIDVRVPPGPRGEMGFAIGSSGTAILPLEAGAFVVTDDELLSWPLTDQINSGSWQLFGYNTGQFPHQVYVRFLTTPPQLAGSAPGGGPIPAGDLGGSLPPPVGLPPELPPPAPPAPPTPPSSTPPLSLLPGLPGLPGAAPSGPPGGPAALLLGVDSDGSVWLLALGRLLQLPSQPDVDALQQAGLPAASIDAAQAGELQRRARLTHP